MTFPEFRLGTTQTGFMGYSFDISTGQNLTDKGLTLSFLVSNNWMQYLLLLKWFELQDFTNYTEAENEHLITYEHNGKEVQVDDSNFKTPFDTGKNPYWTAQGPKIDANLYLMDNFNNRLVTITFTDTWLSNLKQVDLDYAKTSDTEIVTTADFKFYKYNIKVHDEFLINMLNAKTE